MKRWMGLTLAALSGVALGCTQPPSAASSLEERLLACETAPEATCETEAAAYAAPADVPERWYVNAMADACPVGGVPNCKAVVRWTSGGGKHPLPLLRANCEQGSVKSCGAAATLLAEEDPEQSAALQRLGDRFESEP